MTVSKKAADKAKEKAIALRGKSTHHLSGFSDFVREQGIVGLAIGLAVGGAATVLIKSLLDNVIMPPIGLLLGSSDGLKGLAWKLGESRKDGKVVDIVLHYGSFLNDLINFLIIALVIYFVVRVLGLDKKFDKKKE
ncbi:MAG: MscL family protein [Candidatus Saccharimonadales bacterium]